MADERYVSFRGREATVEESDHRKRAKIFPFIHDDVSHCE